LLGLNFILNGQTHFIWQFDVADEGCAKFYEVVSKRILQILVDQLLYLLPFGRIQLFGLEPANDLAHGRPHFGPH